MKNASIKDFFRWLTNPPVDGPKSTLLLRVMAGGVFLWEGILKFTYANQGVGTFHETRDAISPFHGRICRLARDRWRIIAAFRPDDATDRDSIHRRNDRGHTFHENLAIPGNVSVAPAAVATAGGNMGGVA